MLRKLHEDVTVCDFYCYGAGLAGHNSVSVCQRRGKILISLFQVLHFCSFELSGRVAHMPREVDSVMLDGGLQVARVDKKGNFKFLHVAPGTPLLFSSEGYTFTS